MKKILILALSLISIGSYAQLIPFASSQLIAQNVTISGTTFTVAGTCIRTVTGSNYSITGSCLNAAVNYNPIVPTTCAGTIAGSNWTVSGVCLSPLRGITYATVAGVSIYNYAGTITNRIYLTSAVGINVVAADYANFAKNILVSSFDLATGTVPSVSIYELSGRLTHRVFQGTQTALGGGTSVVGASFVDSGNLYVTFSNGSIILYSPTGRKISKIK